jgi:hypothetical protein
MLMQYSFEATEVGIDNSDEALTIGFANIGPDGNYYPSFLIQRFISDENEDNPGIEEVYIELNGQENSSYGKIIEAVELSRNQIKIKLSESSEIVNDKESPLNEIIISFKVGDSKYEEIMDSLKNIIFRDCTCFTIRN